MLIRLFRTHLIGGYRSLLILLVVLQFVQASCTLLLPAINAAVIDDGVLTGDTAVIWRLGGVMVGVAGVQMVFAVAAMWVAARAAMGFGRDLRSDLFHRVTSFSQREVNLLGAPSLITRVTNDVQQVQLLGVMMCSMAITAPLMAIGGVIMALREDVGLSAILLVSLPVLVVILFAMIGRMVPTFRLMQERIDGINRVMREQLVGIRVVRAFVREPEETARFDGVNVPLTDTSLKAGRLMALMFPVVMFVVNASSVAVIWFGAGRIQSGSMTIGAMVAFLSYFTMILMSIMMASFVLLMAPRASVSAERIVEVLETDTSVHLSPNPASGVNGTGTLELRNVSFGYPGADEPVLDHISFTSRPGEMTAIIGSTGAGKSTLVDLIPRLVDVTAGAVLVDGVDVRDLDPEMLWRRVGVVPQKPYLFTGTVASNLRYGHEEATEDEMWAALRGRSSRRLRTPDGWSRRVHRAGWLERVGRAAPTALDRPSHHRQAGDLRVRRFVLGSRPGDRRPPPGGSRPLDRRSHRRGGGPAGLHHHQRRPDHRPREWRDGGDRHPRRAPRALSDLRRDRGVPDQAAGGGGVSDTTTERPADDLGDDDRPSAPAPIITGPRMSNIPGEQSRDFGHAVRRTLWRLRQERIHVSGVVVLAAIAVGMQVLGPKILGARHQHHRGRPADRQLGLHRHPPHAAARRRALRRGRSPHLSAGVVARRHRPGRHVRDCAPTSRPRSTACRCRYVDRQARGDMLSRVTNDIDNMAQSLQQTLGSMLTAALTIIGVVVMMLTISPVLALRRPGDDPRLAAASSRIVAARSRTRFMARSGATPASSTRQVEESITGHAIVKAFGRQHEVEARFRETNEEMYGASFGGPVLLRVDPADR